MHFFTLAVLPAQSTHVPVLENNINLDCGEELPHQKGAQVIHVLKGQDG